MVVNLNDSAEFTLTIAGANIYNQALDAKKKSGDMVRMQLWEAFNVFGDHIYMGCQVPFESNVIRLNQ